MSTFIETVVYHDKNDYINKRRFLVCDNCYWCLSYLPDLENDPIKYFNKCPKCNEEIKAMFISEKASERVDSEHVQNIMTESENWVV
jgi:transcription initiation factor IIE alpha subunit